MPRIMPMSALMSALLGAGRQHLTASTVAAERKVVTASHVLRLQRYTEVIRKEVPNGRSLGSTTFGDGDWRIICYPNGMDRMHDGYMSLFLKSENPFASKDAPARLEASVLDRAGKAWRTQATGYESFSSYRVWGWQDFVKNDDLDEVLVDDCLTVMCDVTVDQLPLDAEEVTIAPPPETAAAAALPFDARGHRLAEAIWSKQPTDVKVHVGGVTIAAHRWVLEAGSPVFKTDLQNTSELRIADMDAVVFMALFQSVYTDGALPETHQLEVPRMAERVLVAADRYGLEKLKLACGEVLSARVDMGSVEAMLGLAERHGCAVLKEACIKFLSCSGNLRSFVAKERLEKDCSATVVNIVAEKLPSLDGWQKN